MASAWVRAEADDGRQRGILVPVMLDAGVRLPLAFRQIQAANLVDWQGEETYAEFVKVVRALTALLGVPPMRDVPEPEEEAPVEPLVKARAEPAGPSTIELVPEPPPVAVGPPPHSEPPRVQETRPVRSKKPLLWGIAVLLLMALPVLYKVLLDAGNGSQLPPGQEVLVTPPPLASPDSTVKNSIGMEFVLIKAGEFRMGSTDGLDDERPVHTVRISRPFYLWQYEVTQEQWQAVMGQNPSGFPGDLKRPVEQVSWDNVQEFIRKLNTKDGVALYRLPTEAEWEYAERAGTTTAYSFGDDEGQLPEYAWYEDNSGGTTHPVGQRKANPWGVYDMHGNVWEWVQDWYGGYTAAAAVDPAGPSTGSDRVIRGGSWLSDAGNCRSASRDGAEPGDRNRYLGVRLLRTAP